MQGREDDTASHRPAPIDVSQTDNDPTRSDGSGFTRAVAHTLAALINVDVVGADALHLRHDNGQHGHIVADDILEGRLRVIDPRVDETFTYEDIEALVAAGWSVTG